MLTSTIVAAILAAGSAHAAPEPYLAVRTGLQCSACHVNRSGGGGRSAYGSVYAQTQLAMRTGTVRNRALNDFLALGWDVRALGSATVEDYAQGSPRTAIELGEANVYLEARMIERKLALYLDQTLGPGPSGAREAFALIEGLPLNGYAKAGKFLLPYGLRLQDDAEFIRSQTGFSYQTPDQGIEVGFEPGVLSFFIALSNGTAGAAEDNNGKQFTSTLAIVKRRFRLGGSASRNEGNGLARRDGFGGFAGFAVGPLSVLGEVDQIAERVQSGAERRQLAGYVEGDFLAARGVNAKVTYGYFDKNLDVAEDQRVRLRFGLEVFPVGFLRAAAFYTADLWIPQARAPDLVSLEFHLHF
ncbi:MAG: hypothetical protein HYV20_06515 [Gemmatimonadetes bacterium]|nr:hypothetical protein [Gemmatimonadota bacterium]